MQTPNGASSVPFWADAIHQALVASLPAQAMTRHAQYEIDAGVCPESEAEDRIREHFTRAEELIPKREQMLLLWLQANLQDHYSAIAPQLREDHWRYLRLRFCDRILSETTLLGLSAATSTNEPTQPKSNLTQLGLVLRGMCERLLGTDALLDRPKVRYTIKRLSIIFGEKSGPWVGTAIQEQAALSETFSLLALAFSVDAWRFWAMAEEWDGYDMERNTGGWEDPRREARESWARFLEQLIYCRIAADAAVEASLAENSAESFDRLRASIAQYHDGGSLSEVLFATWSDFKSELSAGKGGTGSSVEWWPVFGAHKQLRFGSLGHTFCEELLWMHATADMPQVKPPKWSATRAERWYWIQTGDNIEATELKRLLG